MTFCLCAVMMANMSRPWKTVSCYPTEPEWRAWRQWAFDSDVKMSSLVLAAMHYVMSDQKLRAKIVEAAAEIDQQRRGSGS